VTSSRGRILALGDRLAVSFATAKCLPSAKDSLLSNEDEVQRWPVSLRENPRQYKSIFGFTKGHDGGLRASVGKRSPEYSTRSPFFLLPWGRPINKVTPMGTKIGSVPHYQLGRRRSKKRKLTLLKAIDSEGCFHSS